MKTNNLTTAIERASTAIRYITWAMQEEDPKGKLEWLKEAEFFIENSKEWLNKEIPF